MSTQQPPNPDRKPPHAYEGPDKYNDWIEDYLGVHLTDAQREIGRSVVGHERTLVVGANGFGKSYFLACLILAFLFTNYPASVLATSGTYGKLRRTVCKPVQSLHTNAWGLPGEYKKTPPRVEIEDDPDLYFQAAAPADAGELEGVHNTYTLGIIEEADKKRVDEEVFDSMASLLTDDRDRLVAVANPPRDEVNIVADLVADPAWHVLRYSSFESHNVQVELGSTDGPMVDGLVTLDRIKTDWESWNGEPWPGVQEARTSHTRDDLDQRWYRRRLGVTPPDTAEAHRPFSVQDVEAAWERDAPRREAPQGLGLDVARMGGDHNALAGKFGATLVVLDYWRGLDHVENEDHVLDTIDTRWGVAMMVDAVGDGSGLADRLTRQYAPTERFQAGAKPSPTRRTQFRDKWAEGMYLLGQFLKDGGSIIDRRLREELLAAARSVEFETKYLASRNSEILELSSKDAIKERLGRSPDLLDAAYMSVYAADDNTGSQARTIPATW